ncbi:MAG: hypothetical protein RLN62_01460 [Rickettsiales bacterium]
MKFYTSIIPGGSGNAAIIAAYEENSSVQSGISQIQKQNRCLHMKLMNSDKYHISLAKDFDINNKLCDGIETRDFASFIHKGDYSKSSSVQACMNVVKKEVCALYRELLSNISFAITDKDILIDGETVTRNFGRYIAVSLRSEGSVSEQYTEYLPNNPHISVIVGSKKNNPGEGVACLTELKNDYLKKSHDRNLEGSITNDALRVDYTHGLVLDYNAKDCAGETDNIGDEL